MSIRTHHPAGLIVASFMGLLATASAYAVDQEFVPYARVRYDYNSNIFALPDPSSLLPDGYATRVGDHVTTYFGGVESTLPFDRQTLLLNVEGRHVAYNRLDYLDHNEYTLAGDLKWQLGNATSGDVRYHEVKQMAPFADRVGTALSIETERIFEAFAKFQILPEWSVTPRYFVRNLEAPEPGYPNFTLRENTEDVKIQYAGFGPLSVGVDLEHLSDSYLGVPNVPEVGQYSVQTIADYKVTGLTTLDAALGATKRTQGVLSNAQTAWTGALAYRRQFTAKSSINAQVSRAFNSYVFAGSSELDTTEGIGAEWDATRKLTVKVGYQHTTSDFVGYIVPGTGVPGRKDKINAGVLSIDYQPLRWITIQPHLSRQRRESNQAELSFNDTIIGVDVTFKPYVGP